MIALIKKSGISGNLKAPASKSHAIRLVLYSLIGNVKVHGLPDSSDVKVAIDLVQKMGIEKKGESFIHHGRDLNHRADLYFGGSGTALRMALPILAYTGGEFAIDGDETLRARPVTEEIRALSSAGIRFSSDSIPLRMSGRATADHIAIAGSESSQSISGLIYALLMSGGGRIEIIPPVVSKHYIDLTCSILASLGADISFTGNVIRIGGGSMRAFSGHVPGDYLLSSFYAAAAYATGGHVSISGLPEQEKWWGDHSIVKVLEDSGVESSFAMGTWNAGSSKQGRGINVDITQSPDMAVSVAAFAPFLQGKTTISGIAGLKFKESNRIRTITETLSAFGVNISSNGSMTIDGQPFIENPVLDSGGDHRIAMLASVLSLHSGGKIMGTECVSKSNPEFFMDLIKMGGDVKLIQ
ncbi:MAG: hypothetical protein QXN26_03905 [Thermoplasmataceae archaeon]